ncbi:hypothetical protein [Nocardioides xinjiangensis]|uniref:hypothetical protein n=1 Tax=Nocardioides xinjiangensis TaxID=2817376 RepID=UPI001B309556|nr:MULTISPECIES: hypothetical protein [unclassified Nocardioides]
MPDPRRVVLATCVVVPFLLGAATGAPGPVDRPAFRFTDAEIVESSGLVVVDDLVVTTNDSGDSGRVFAVDATTGDTVGVTSWPTAPEDAEALAPAGRGHVWVGDIGDNRRARDAVVVLRVPVGRGDASAVPEGYELVYPDGAHDAEALLSHPLTGRLFVVTKGVFAGSVYAAPTRLRSGRPNPLTRVGEAPGMVTDATFLPGGGGVVMRTYTAAHLTAFPSWQPVGSWPLPGQEQGEGLALAGRGLLVSTEGARTEVLRVDLPAAAGRTDLRSPAWTALRCLATAYGLPL